MTNVVEFQTFKLKEGVAVSDFLSESDKFNNEFLSKQKGYLAKAAAKVRLEYGIDYVKSNGKISRKIFQISESPLKVNDKKQYTKKHDFADLSARKHYPGIHSIVLIVKGVESGKLAFELNTKEA